MSALRLAARRIATRAPAARIGRTAHALAVAPVVLRRRMTATASDKPTANTTAAAASAEGAAAASPKRIRVYTRTGDGGTTSLFNMERRPKSDPTLHALGDIDELNAQLGVCNEHIRLSVIPIQQIGEQLPFLQSRLLDAGAHVATPRNEQSNAAQLARTVFDAAHIDTLEQWIDAMDDALPPLRNFILPSGGLASAHLHVARAVCRRAERTTVELMRAGHCEPVVVRFLNRLSDYLFVAARYAAHKEGKPETLWHSPKSRAGKAAAAAAAAAAATPAAAPASASTAAVL